MYDVLWHGRSVICNRGSTRDLIQSGIDFRIEVEFSLFFSVQSTLLPTR